MKILVLLAFLPILLAQEAKKLPKNPNYFTVVAQQYIRCGKPYTVEIRGFDLKRSVKLSVKISGTGDDGSEYEESQSAYLSPDDPADTLRFDVGQIPSGKYRLNIEGGGYSTSRKLNYLCEPIFLLQTRKPVYRPGERVRYRIYSINTETRIANPKGVNVTIINPNRDFQLLQNSIEFYRGKYEGFFDIPLQTNPGSYKIVASNNIGDYLDDSLNTIYFRVDDYDLPQVYAKLIVPDEIAFSSGKFTIKVETGDFFKFPVIGEGKVEIEIREKLVYTRYFETDSEVQFEVDLANDLNLTQDYYYFPIYLTFNDPRTGKTVIDKKNLGISKYDRGFVFTGDEFFRPNQFYYYQIAFRQFGGVPVPEGTDVSFEIRETFYTKPEIITRIPSSSPADGILSASWFPGDDLKSLTITAKAANTPDISRTILSPKEYNQDKILLRALTDEPKLFSPVTFEATVFEPIDYIIVHFASKGVLLETQKVWFNNRDPLETSPFSRKITLKKLTARHIPTVDIVAYYIKNGVINIDTAYLNSPKLLNYVKFSFDEIGANPGQTIEFQVEAYQDSIVSLAAIDQRLLLPENQIILNKEQVLRKLHRYSALPEPFDPDLGPLPMYENRCENAGLYCLSNIPNPNAPTRSKRSVGGPTSTSPIFPSETPVRTRFSEAILWRDVYINEFVSEDENGRRIGRGTVKTTLPDSLGSYYLTGVAMSEYDGIGFSEPGSNITIFKKFFILMDPLPSIKRGDTYVQSIYIYNYLEQQQTFTVTIPKTRNFGFSNMQQYGWKETNDAFTNVITSRVQRYMLKIEFRGRRLGIYPFKVTARGSFAGDAIEKAVRVVPEGVLRQITDTVEIQFDDQQNTFSNPLACKFPEGVNRYGKEVYLTLTGKEPVGAECENYIDFTFSPNVGSEIHASLNSENVLAKQRFDLNEDTNRVQIEAFSYATVSALVTLTCNFYQDESAAETLYEVNYEVIKACRLDIELRVCTRFITQGGNSGDSTMRVTLPSGFYLYSEINNPDVYEVNNSGTTVTLRFHFITNTFTCVDIRTRRFEYKAGPYTGIITVFDSQRTYREGVATYEINDLENCVN